MNHTFPLGIAAACAAGVGALAVVLTVRAEIARQPRANSTSVRPERPATRKAEPRPSSGEVALRGLDALLGERADPWLGVLAQAAVFALFVLLVKRGFRRSCSERPARRADGHQPDKPLPAGYREHFPRAAVGRDSAVARRNADGTFD
jgi:hypothetical protein